jgi:vancomycin resistance protein YoaR
MKFRNDTDAPILILPEVDERNQKLYFRFYSAPTGRTVTMEGPVVENPVAAGEPVYEEDPTLSPGVRVQVERAHDGIDATIYRTVTRDGVVIAEDKVFSRYAPWPARYRVGPSASAPAE